MLGIEKQRGDKFSGRVNNTGTLLYVETGSWCDCHVSQSRMPAEILQTYVYFYLK